MRLVLDRRYTAGIRNARVSYRNSPEGLNEVLGKRLTRFESWLSARLKKGSTMVLVLTALVDTLPTLLAMAAAGLFAVMAWAGSSAH